jgi:hypothetical protein
VVDYTYEQINLFAHFALERKNRETFTGAHSAAVGAAVGFTGQTDILNKLAQDLGVEVGKGSAVPRSLRNLLSAAVATQRQKQRDGGD